MPTGACGINCEVCKLMVTGLCSSCGPGNSDQGARKLSAQSRILGSPCPILACAHMNRIAYCTRDCRQFPCDNFTQGPYPYAVGFLNMQTRRRQEKPPARSPAGATVEVPALYWETLTGMDAADVCTRSMARTGDTGGYCLNFLNREVWVDITERTLKEKKGGRWEAVVDPLLELVLLLYLQHATDSPLSFEMVTVNELREKHFFVGYHTLDIDGVLKRFGNDPEGFEAAARALGGTAKDYADRAFTFMPLPKVPVTYLLWLGDDEFPARLTVCFDRSIENHFAADGIWALVKRLSFEIVSTG